MQIWEQEKGPDTVRPFWPHIAPELSYSLPEFGLVMPFRPTDFTQVNVAINRALVSRAMRLLQPQPGERIADLFCGLGNFTLPIARSGAEVLGIEGSAELVARARDNALHNGLANAHFAVDNLFEMTPEKFAALGHIDKLLIDPPRSGAIEVVKALPESRSPQRIVYVSCDPATLARDAEMLCTPKATDSKRQASPTCSRIPRMSSRLPCLRANPLKSRLLPSFLPWPQPLTPNESQPLTWHSSYKNTAAPRSPTSSASARWPNASPNSKCSGIRSWWCFRPCRARPTA